MAALTHQVARKADRALSWAHYRVRRFLERGQKQNRSGPKLTIGRAYDAGWEGMECVFVLSTGRTGTQTLAAMLRLSPQIVAEHEPAPRLVKATYDAFMESHQEDWLDRWTPFVLAARDDLVLQANAKGKVYVESNNRLTYVAKALQQAFPASKFIFSHRDPYQVIRSGMRRGAYQGPNMAWNFARIKPLEGETEAPHWDRLTPLEKEAWRWARINQEAKSFFDALPEGRRLELPAKTFFSKDMDVYRQIFEFIGVPCPEEANLQAILGRKMNAQAHFNGLSFDWTDEKKAAVKPFIASVATELGYDV